MRKTIFVKYGWKPGAISKRLLRALNDAKLRRSPGEQATAKKTKRQVDPKPLLRISKKDGEYRVEMNMLPGSKDGVECTPVTYRIETVGNKARIKKKERKQRRLVSAALNSTWSDPYHPENCENICLPAYKQVLGIQESDVYTDRDENVENDILSSYSDVDVSSSCSSSDIDWELYFSPPSAFRKQIAASEKV